ncbi:hypothetical protein KBZ12_07945 [Cyanobium sp. Cruz CV13-4-11]|uniref:type II toxin-antitoxin system RelE family toxin n=1 Tax=unclassified Cyanobium TaxID=2627006 RepID=UPI0020CC9515|nr:MULTISPECIES: hypothetical protein [unclassified Cyanobium]MCP9900333.1 hypothetical protein [Cyanobium sp. Cruz CV11-17]MCP9919417.1 hypothetical protein [Cyanobium sp. Cruz CV13-4-11]
MSSSPKRRNSSASSIAQPPAASLAICRKRSPTAGILANAAKGLTANRAGLWRFWVGDDRVICQIETARLLVLVVKVSH